MSIARYTSPIHCFDRVVILGHMPLLTRPEHIVHFFRDVHGTSPITNEALRQRTNEYHHWVDAFARNQDIPVEWAQKGVRKEGYVRPSLHRMERHQRFGVYFILKSMEVGPSFRISTPKFPTADPHYRHVAPQRTRYTHYFLDSRRRAGPDAAAVCGVFLAFRTHRNAARRTAVDRRERCVPHAVRHGLRWIIPAAHLCSGSSAFV